MPLKALFFIAVAGFSQATFAQDLEQYLGSYQCAETGENAVLQKDTIKARMGASRDEDRDAPAVEYDYFRLRVSGEHFPAINIYLNKAGNYAIICSSINTPTKDPYSSDPNGYFVYNQACKSVSLPTETYEYIDHVGLLMKKVGVSLEPAKNAKALRVTQWDVIQNGIFSKQTKKVCTYQTVKSIRK